MTINGGTNASGWTFKLEAYERGYSIANNTSEVRVDMYLGRASTQSYLGGDWSGSITVDGSTQYLSGNIPYPTYINGGDWLYLGTKDFTVGHNTDGTKTAAVSASFASGDFSPSSAWANGNLTLSNIPRYASISQSLSSKTETSITMNWSSDNTIDRIWYSTDNGSTWSSGISVNAKSGSYTINNLTANTTYNIKTRVRRKDSQLTTDSSKLSVATYDYPHVSNLVNRDFIIGDAITVDFYNPLSRTITYTFYNDKDEVIEYNTGAVSSVNTTFDADSLYESIPDKSTGNWYVIVEYGEISRTSDIGTYTINVNECTPEFEDFTFRDSNVDVVAITGNNQILVKNLSTLEVTIPVADKMIAKKYATGSRYDISCANRGSSVNYSDENDLVSTLDTISTVGTVACNVKAIDSRNLNTTVSKSINVIDYTKPNIVTNVGRVNNFETSTNISCTGSFSKIVVDNTVKNNITVARFRYKKMNESNYGSWTNFDVTVNKNNGTYECANKVVLLDNTQTYMIEFEIKDEFTSEIVVVIVSEGIPIMFLSSTNKNVGIGKQNAHEEYSLDVLNGIYCDTLHCNNYDGPGGTGGGGETLPVGAIIEYPANLNIPTGWMICDGSAISRTEYAKLFSIYGTTFGAGDGSTTFNIPSKKGRVSVGLDTSQTEFNTIGKTGGSKYLQRHKHEGLNWMGDESGNGDITLNSGSAEGCYLNYGGKVRSGQQKYIHTYNTGTGDSGNLQPYFVSNFIVKVSETTPIQAQVVDSLDGNSTTDAPSQRAVKQLTTYSTTETKIGTWIDGKPIYRKTVSGRYTTNNTRATVDLVSGVNKFINGYGVYSPNSLTPTLAVGQPMISTGGGIDAYSQLRISTNNILQVCFSTPQGAYQGLTGSYEITVEYTKTTD